MGKRGRPFGFVAPKPSLARDEQGRKFCNGCALWLSTDVFGRNDIVADGLTTYCKPCEKARARERNLLKKYGLTLERFAQMLSDQGGRCAICGDEIDATTTHVDHDSSCCDLVAQRMRGCGACVRGLLCAACNLGIGCLKHDVERLEASIAHLSR